MEMAVVIEAIKHRSASLKLVEFSSFILSRSKSGTLPDYCNINLMEIPHLVPHVFVFDVLNSSDKLMLKYCGTKIDGFYGVNMTGKCIIDYYKGEEGFDEVEAIFWQGIHTKKPAYTCRTIHLENDYVNKYMVAETVMFPCSSDAKTINYTLGFADYYYVQSDKEHCVTLIE